MGNHLRIAGETVRCRQPAMVVLFWDDNKRSRMENHTPPTAIPESGAAPNLSGAVSNKRLSPINSNTIATPQKKPYGAVTILLAVLFIIGAVVYGFPSIRMLPYIPLLMSISPLAIAVFFSELATAILCVVTIVYIFQRKRLAIRLAYITLGIFLASIIINGPYSIQEASFYNADLSVYGATILLSVTIHLVIFTFLFLFVKRSKHIRSVLVK